MKFGEYLVDHDFVSPEILNDALDIQRYQSVRLGRLLVALGVLSPQILDRALAGFFENPSCELSLDEILGQIQSSTFGPELEQWTARNRVIAFRHSENRLLCLADRFSDAVVMSGEKELGLSVTFEYLSVPAFEYLTKDQERSKPLARKPLARKPLARKPLALRLADSDEERLQGVSPYIELFRDMILEAKRLNASDIHIQPNRNGVGIRFRVLGDMCSWKDLPAKHRLGFINEAKRLSNLSVSMHGKPQDGRISFQAWNLDLRTSLLPCQYGEKLVLRLLDLTRKFELSALEFDEKTEAGLMQALSEKNGVILISGPTGSGKTTTLYTLLCQLDRKRLNIVTLEDPIEYGIEGLTQVQVGPKLGFSQALRSVLRQDPDVILVGEIRDAETADLCMKAASTGHLVLSTIHANGAAEVLQRLLQLGCDPITLGACIRFSAAQRLLKKLCPRCSLPFRASDLPTLPQWLPFPWKSLPAVTQFRRKNPVGCGHCSDGAIGRVAVLESMNKESVNAYFKSPERKHVDLICSIQEASFIRAVKGEVDVEEAIQAG